MITGMNKINKTLFIALTLLTTGVSQAADTATNGLMKTTDAQAAQTTSTQSWTLTELMAALAEVKTRNDTFTETKHLSVLEQPLRMSGKLFFSAPDRIEKHIEKPEPSAYIVKGSELLIRMFRQRERKVVLFQYPAIQAFVESMRATLAGDLKTLKEYYTVGFKSNGQDWQLNLEPVDEDMKDYVTEITIKGHNTQLSTIETQERDSDRSIMTIQSGRDH